MSPYAVEEGFDASFVPVSRGFPEIPSEPIHQFAVELRAELPAREEGRMDLLAFADFIDERFPRWPQLTPEQLRRVLEMDDYARFVGKRVDLWGWAEEVEVEWYSVSRTLRWSTRERVGTDSSGRPKYRTRTSRWVVQVPAVRARCRIRGTEGESWPASFDRVGDATATGHHRQTITAPAPPPFVSAKAAYHGTLTELKTFTL